MRSGHLPRRRLPTSHLSEHDDPQAVKEFTDKYQAAPLKALDYWLEQENK